MTLPNVYTLSSPGFAAATRDPARYGMAAAPRGSGDRERLGMLARSVTVPGIAVRVSECASGAGERGEPKISALAAIGPRRLARNSPSPPTRG
ncbi:hypothetical protein CALCODRAFT_500838 [Calocera cornea HHB12733]|uniref:Uncharacterized protein n=1 Tax=Calocera cornea HHB12733 TaxID=1353952 RepID=A0A165DWI7_9BASI|nr:hypothetical protein CALCODRAFT_500838 [Calocera cornea HHB12733]